MKPVKRCIECKRVLVWNNESLYCGIHRHLSPKNKEYHKRFMRLWRAKRRKDKGTNLK